MSEHYLYHTSKSILKIFAIGPANRLDELSVKAGLHELTMINESSGAVPPDLSSFDLVMDLNLDDHPHRIKWYGSLNRKWVFVCAVKKKLAELIHDSPIKCHLAGMNALPAFINRSQWEISLRPGTDRSSLDQLMKKAQWDYLVADDIRGMITPRVIFMIINEACFTLDANIASIEDIDKGMKLGTGYPYGPFEWCDRIGIKDVYETLEAVGNETNDPRYKICPLLKDKYLLNERFYQ